ncbi:MAG TPA: flagellar hook capping FlgD N-terminal domain-containing protein [Blastocatellia bacterium]|nr:flagellar hook capping FlgD N-terminal domain-containing protein [Blastocatellia bacterium]
MQTNAILSGSNSIATTPSASTAKSNSTSSPGLANEQEFLQLLVTQLEHQDPLQPQDSTQFVAQLAQFSSLEQLININQNISTLVGQNGSTTSATTNAVRN